MNYTERYISKEYLALKIHYCREQLDKLPTFKLHIVNQKGQSKKQIICGRNRHYIDTESGKQAYALMRKRDLLERELNVFETIWNCNFRGTPSDECMPHPVIRSMLTSDGESVTLNKAFFDSLENNANAKHKDSRRYEFDGIYYRSAAEREIAIFYTEMGIPFKYEPEIRIAGVPRPINPDFVIYIKELDLCIIHEHCGMMNYSNYLRVTAIKYGNYTNAGLIPGTDILFTYDTDDLPFDIRCLASLLNSTVYNQSLRRS